MTEYILNIMKDNNDNISLVKLISSLFLVACRFIIDHHYDLKHITFMCFNYLR